MPSARVKTLAAPAPPAAPAAVLEAAVELEAAAAVAAETLEPASSETAAGIHAGGGFDLNDNAAVPEAAEAKPKEVGASGVDGQLVQAERRLAYDDKAAALEAAEEAVSASLCERLADADARLERRVLVWKVKQVYPTAVLIEYSEGGQSLRIQFLYSIRSGGHLHPATVFN